MIFRVIATSLSLIISISALYEGEQCVVPETGGNGKCVSIMECELAKKLLKSGQTPKHCGFNSKFPLICCPLAEPPIPEVRSVKSGRRSAQKCNDYHDRLKQVLAVAGGTKAAPMEFPHMVALGYVFENRTLWLCGGSLISHNFVLTAAHCTISRDFGPVKWARLGDLDLQNTTEEAKPKDLPIKRLIAHPDYKSSSHYNDIALLKLEEEVEFGLFIRPACLPTNNSNNVKLQAIGWGKTDFFGESSSHLMKVDLQIIDQENCTKAYARNKLRKLSLGINNHTQICAGGYEKDTCPGDSGGPLHYRDPGNVDIVGHYVVVGITSFGKACGLGPTIGVYTKVEAFLQWIEDIVWPVATNQTAAINKSI